MHPDFISIFPETDGQSLAAFTTTRASGIISIPALQDFLQKHYPWIQGIHYLQQIHSASWIEVHDRGAGATCYPDLDALFTFDADQALIVQTADCVPIFLFHQPSGFTGLIHAGWRGVYQDILSAMLHHVKLKYSLNLREIMFGFGPFIRECCFEVGPEVINQFAEKYPEVPGMISANHINLQSILLYQCSRLNIPRENIFVSAECTMCSENIYYSFRREGLGCQRLYSVIAQKKNS